MIDNNKVILDEDTFTKLLRAARDSYNFETQKIAYIQDPSYTQR